MPSRASPASVSKAVSVLSAGLTTFAAASAAFTLIDNVAIARFGQGVAAAAFSPAASAMVARLTPDNARGKAFGRYGVGVCFLPAEVEARLYQRWLDLGFIRFQPSEIMKIGVPLMLAWAHHPLGAWRRLRSWEGAAVLVLLPLYNPMLGNTGAHVLTMVVDTAPGHRRALLDMIAKLRVEPRADQVDIVARAAEQAERIPTGVAELDPKAADVPAPGATHPAGNGTPASVDVTRVS